MRVPLLTSLLVAPLVVACTSLLGIDDNYVYGGLEADAGATGATSSTGGTPFITGGAGGVSGGQAGTPPIGGTGGQDPECQPGQKLCVLADQGPVCVPPDPSVGCGLDDCTSCNLAVSGGFAICGGATGDQCDFQCLEGFVRNDATRTCDPVQVDSGAGGVVGTGGAGTGGACSSPADCASCSPVLPGCCAPVVNRCGCFYVAWCQPN